MKIPFNIDKKYQVDSIKENVKNALDSVEHIVDVIEAANVDTHTHTHIIGPDMKILCDKHNQ